MNIGEIIKKLREENKKTQEDLASYLGIAPQTIYKYEKGINEPDITTINKLATYFNVSADYLLGRTHSKNTIKEIDKKMKDNNIVMAASSKFDLGQLAATDEKTAKLINTILNDFTSEDK